MPLSPILHAWAKTVEPSPSKCSLKRRPRPALASIHRRVALRTSSGSRRMSLDCPTLGLPRNPNKEGSHGRRRVVASEDLEKFLLRTVFSSRMSNDEEIYKPTMFYQDAAGTVFHTYSCYARGLDMMNATYHYLDLVPKGRDESGPHKMAWVRYR